MATIYLFTYFAVLPIFLLPVIGQLSPDFYDEVCPQALPTIKLVVEQAIELEPRMGASLVRLHFHDCFVNLGGSSYDVLLGRRDSTTASKDAANTNIPSPLSNLSALVSNFESHGLALEDLVVLSGAHTLGFSRCVSFRNRIYNETSTIDGDFAASLQAVCPPSGDDDNLAPLDDTPASFDTAYYQDLMGSRGLLHSDQQLFMGDGSAADELVENYSENPDAFSTDFGAAMIKMGNISPLTGSDGEIRENCRVVNSD